MIRSNVQRFAAQCQLHVLTSLVLPGRDLLTPRQNNGLGVGVYLFPIWTGSKGSDQRSIRGKDQRLNSPPIEGHPPIVPEIVGSGEVVHEAVAVDIRAPIGENAVLRIQLPDEIAAKVVVVQNRSGGMLTVQKRNCG